MAKNAESEGIDSLWGFERLLWPINPQTQYGDTPERFNGQHIVTLLRKIDNLPIEEIS